MFLALGLGKALDGLFEEIFVVVEARAVGDSFVVLWKEVYEEREADMSNVCAYLASENAPSERGEDGRADAVR